MWEACTLPHIRKAEVQRVNKGHRSSSYSHQFEMYKTNDKDTDALCPAPGPSARSACTRHHHPPKQHLSSSISQRSSTRCFSIPLKIPAKAVNHSIRTAAGGDCATYFPETALSQDSQKVKIFNVVLPEPWNSRGWCCQFARFLELRVRVGRLCGVVK